MRFLVRPGILVLVHGFIALTYIVLSVAAAAGLYANGSGVEAPVAAASGGALLLISAFFHLSVSRQRRERAIVDALSGLHGSQAQLQTALAASRDELRLLLVAFDKVMREPHHGCAEVAAEVRVLETLLRQISPQTGAAQRYAAISPPVPTVSMASGAPENIDDEETLGAIREALHGNRVDVYLQPVVSLPQRKSTFYETFSRLRGGDDRQIEPAEYLVVAERAGLVTAIDNNLLFRCIQLVRKTQRRQLGFGFFCNISPYTLRDTSFFPEFIEFMEQNHRLATNLIFEFPQADLKNHNEQIVRNLGRLSEMGFRFSIDQVETIDLDLEELTDRHISFVKVEAATLLENLDDTAASIQLHRMKRALDRAGISLVVEKVEEEEQLIELLDYGIDFGQGYLFGPPRLSREGD